MSMVDRSGAMGEPKVGDSRHNDRAPIVVNLRNTEKARIREKILAVFKWLYTVENMDTEEVVKYVRLHADDIMQEALNEYHTMDWE